MVPVFIEVREVNSSSHLLTKYTKIQRVILTGLKDRGGDYSIYPLVGRCNAAPHTLTLFKTNIADFPTLFKIEFRFLIACLRHLSCLRHKLINRYPD